MSRRELVGLAAAACVACCAGPVLAAIGGIAALGTIGTLTLGPIALVTAAAVILGVVTTRHRERRQARIETQRVEIGPPRRRQPHVHD